MADWYRSRACICRSAASRTSRRNLQLRRPRSAACRDSARQNPWLRSTASPARPVRWSAPPSRPTVSDPPDTWQSPCQYWPALRDSTPSARSSIDLPENNLDGADDRHHIREHVAARQLVHGGKMSEARGADFHPVGLVGAVGDEIDPELALGVLHRDVRLARRYVHALGEQLEVVDQLLHVGLHRDARGWCDLVVVRDHRPRIPAQPVHTLPDDAVRLPHLLDANQVPVVAVAVHSNRDVELEPVIHLVGLFLAQIPFDARAAQHRTAETERLGTLRRHHADADRALLPDAILGEQS